MNIELLIFSNSFYQQRAQLCQFLSNFYKYQLLLLPPACWLQHIREIFALSHSPTALMNELGAVGALTYESTPLFISAYLHAPFCRKNTLDWTFIYTYIPACAYGYTGMRSIRSVTWWMLSQTGTIARTVLWDLVIRMSIRIYWRNCKAWRCD